MWHAVCQGLQSSWANCIPQVEDSMPQFWYYGSGERWGEGWGIAGCWLLLLLVVVLVLWGWVGGGGVIHVVNRPHLVPDMLNRVHCRTPSWPVHDPHIHLHQKTFVSHAVWDEPFSWTHRKKIVQTHTPSRKAYHCGEALCSVGGWGVHPATPVQPSHHGEGPQLPSVGWMHVSVSLHARSTHTIGVSKNDRKWLNKKHMQYWTLSLSQT